MSSQSGDGGNAGQPIIPEFQNVFGPWREAVSRIEMAIAPSRILHAQLADIIKPTQALQACLKEIAAPTSAFQAQIKAIIEVTSAIQARMDESMVPKWEFLSHIEKSIAPFRELQAQAAVFTEPFREIAEGLRRSFDTPQMRELLERWHRKNKVREALDAAGWLPHPTIPDDLILNAIKEGNQSISEAVEQHLRENWQNVAEEFMARFRSSGVDDEALAAMDEALKCRGQNLHRATCRTVFPEIERVARLRLPIPNPTKMASLTEVRDAIANLPIHSIRLPGIFWLSVFEHVREACYATVGANATETDFPLPNRHAIAHGRVPYLSPRDSMNSLVIADFMLTSIDAIASNLDPDQPPA